MILDPHYPGTDSLDKILEKKGLAWRKPEEMFKKGIFYNFCLPLIPYKEWWVFYLFFKDDIQSFVTSKFSKSESFLQNFSETQVHTSLSSLHTTWGNLRLHELKPLTIFLHSSFSKALTERQENFPFIQNHFSFLFPSTKR